MKSWVSQNRDVVHLYCFDVLHALRKNRIVQSAYLIPNSIKVNGGRISKDWAEFNTNEIGLRDFLTQTLTKMYHSRSASTPVKEIELEFFYKLRRLDPQSLWSEDQLTQAPKTLKNDRDWLLMRYISPPPPSVSIDLPQVPWKPQAPGVPPPYQGDIDLNQRYNVESLFSEKKDTEFERYTGEVPIKALLRRILEKLPDSTQEKVLKLEDTLSKGQYVLYKFRSTEVGKMDEERNTLLRKLHNYQGGHSGFSRLVLKNTAQRHFSSVEYHLYKDICRLLDKSESKDKMLSTLENTALLYLTNYGNWPGKVFNFVKAEQYNYFGRKVAILPETGTQRWRVSVEKIPKNLRNVHQMNYVTGTIPNTCGGGKSVGAFSELEKHIEMWKSHSSGINDSTPAQLFIVALVEVDSEKFQKTKMVLRYTLVDGNELVGFTPKIWDFLMEKALGIEVIYCDRADKIERGFFLRDPESKEGHALLKRILTVQQGEKYTVDVELPFPKPSQRVFSWDQPASPKVVTIQINDDSTVIVAKFLKLPSSYRSLEEGIWMTRLKGRHWLVCSTHADFDPAFLKRSARLLKSHCTVLMPICSGKEFSVERKGLYLRKHLAQHAIDKNFYAGPGGPKETPKYLAVLGYDFTPVMEMKKLVFEKPKIV